MSEVRVRFAPSPTGYLHVGGLRTALFNYLFAKNQGGKMILRVEDTDQTRKVEGAVENLIESLKWSGIEFDEGPHCGGEHGPYIQSERLDIYGKYIKQLLEQGDAYSCFCASETLDEMRKDQIAKKQPTRYDGRCRRLKPDEVQQRIDAGENHVVRMKIIHSKGDYDVSDLIRGNVIFRPNQIDDQVILKSDGFPTYHLASVVDDHLMGITHVIRGEEWLPSTPKHNQLYEYFGWEAPKYAHLPLLLNADKSKLSKRQGDVATEDYRNKGFLSECLVNFVALLGWNTGDTQEIFSFDELIELFSLDRVGKSGAVFDVNKLKWMNQQYIKNTSLSDLMGLLDPHFPDFTKETSKEDLEKMVEIVQPSLVVLPEIGEKLDLFYKDDLKLTDESLLEITKTEDSQKVYQGFLEQAQEFEEINKDNFSKVMKAVQKATGVKGKNLWIPIRIALTLVEHGPELPLVVDVFGKEKCVKMVQGYLN
ncbi:MAG: nondiscriminating glutamyl-tRNA synthetase [bacterium]|jgi:nondiscriminating glutamyl-tRNA synthetase